MEFFPHTDGAYLDSITVHQNSFRRIQPPKYVILECLTQMSIGGESLIIDGDRILNDVVNMCPRLITPLFDRSVTFFHKNIIANRVPIFEKNEKEGERYSIRYSYDPEMLLPEHLIEPINYFNNEFILNKRYCTTHKLSEREIIVLDNTRVLHGRNEFTGSRELRRAWIYDSDQSTFLTSIDASNQIFYSGDDKITTNPNYGTPIKRELSSEPLSVLIGINLK